MSLEELSIDRREGKITLEIIPEESFIDTENGCVSVSQSPNRQELCDLGSEEYRKKVAGKSAGAIIGCFISGGLVLANYLTFGSSVIYTLAGAGFVLSLGVGICNFKRDFEITQHWYDR